MYTVLNCKFKRTKGVNLDFIHQSLPMTAQVSEWGQILTSHIKNL